MPRSPLALAMAFIAGFGCAHAQYCGIIGAGLFGQDANSTFLGIVSFNKHDVNSIMNEFGSYGSEFSPTSIFNTFSEFGSEFSSFSPANQFATSPPLIIAIDNNGDERLLGLLSRNQFAITPRDWIGVAPVVNPDNLINFLVNGSCGTAIASRKKNAPTATPRLRMNVDVLGRVRQQIK